VAELERIASDQGQTVGGLLRYLLRNALEKPDEATPWPADQRFSGNGLGVQDSPVENA